MILDELIVFSCGKDASTWEIAGPRILKKIAAHKYTLIVPDQDVPTFKTITSKQFNLESDSLYANGVLGLIKDSLPTHKLGQAQWYCQQFIKLSAANARSPDKVIAIWDGDTIPLKPIEFLDLQGKLLYFTGSESHQAYFQTIERLLGLKKEVASSFIAQCFPMRVSWLKEFVKAIELSSGKNWMKAILDSIDFSRDNAFSEYETLGTFIAHNYPDQVNLCEKPWYRLGNSLIGDARLINSRAAQKKLTTYYYVSFEKWDRSKPRFLSVTLPIFAEGYLKPNLSKLLRRKSIGRLYQWMRASQGFLDIKAGVGIFSCCTVRLELILDYFNTHHATPKQVDSRGQFDFYKDDPNEDISQDLFAIRDDIDIEWTGKPIKITDSLDEQQFSNYQELNFKEISLFIQKYFSPTTIISDAIRNLEASSQIDYANTCVIRFRGTDKEAETAQPSYEEMLSKAEALKLETPSLRFAIQTDESKFRSFISEALGKDCFIVEKTHWAGWDGNKDYIDFYASIMLLSKCKYIITTSGNGELWMMLFRGHANGVYQYLQHKELVYGKPNKSYHPGQTSFWLESI